MFAFHWARRACAGAGTIAFIAGCAAQNAPLAAPVPIGSGLPLTLGARAGGEYDGKVFVSDLVNGTVWICPVNFYDIRNGFTFPTGQLSGVSNPVQIAVDREGTVYVANAQTDAAGDGAVTIYPRGHTAPSRTLTTGLNTSLGVAVDSAGTVYVSNKLVASVEVFPKGASAPSSTITANLKGPDGVAVDRAGDLFIADSSANDVLELRHGSTTPQSLHLSGLLRPTGIAVGPHGEVYVANLMGGASFVAVYSPRDTKPSRTFRVRGPYGLFDQPLMLSLARGDLLIVSAFGSLARMNGVWSGYGAVAAGYASGQAKPLWLEYNQMFNYGEFVTYDDAVFQPAR
ncbi:MAG: hypothetical protein JO351_09665 [Candidatus Eremiobacteraeota bacterium]|nr:hypothetical protein [Candidatus Eremiobacteraeota bacterium]MBV9056888.1 hypothetical protein [Candidatus Eremiobacteraeota bacterium]